MRRQNKTRKIEGFGAHALFSFTEAPDSSQTVSITVYVDIFHCSFITGDIFLCRHCKLCEVDNSI